MCYEPVNTVIYHVCMYISLVYNKVILRLRAQECIIDVAEVSRDDSRSDGDRIID